MTAYSVSLWRKVEYFVHLWGIVETLGQKKSRIIMGTNRVSRHQYNQPGRKRANGHACTLS